MTDVQKITRIQTTAETANGPKIEQYGTRLRASYDVEQEDTPTPRWFAIDFIDTLAFRWTPDFACDAGQVGGYSAVAEKRQSEWLASLLNHEEGPNENFALQLHHFIIYFDHEGALEVVARQFEVEPEAVI